MTLTPPRGSGVIGLINFLVFFVVFYEPGDFSAFFIGKHSQHERRKYGIKKAFQGTGGKMAFGFCFKR
jgi:hypothetical protein